KNVIGRAPGAAELVGMEDQLSNPGTTQTTLTNALTATGSAGGFTTITAPAGNAPLTAPKVPTLFDFTNLSFGSDTIAGFDASRDTIKLSHSTVASLTALNNETTKNAAGDSVIAFNGSQSITLTGIAPATLGAANFLIV